MTLNAKLRAAINRLAIEDVTLKRINAWLSDGFDPEDCPDGADLSIQIASPVCRSMKEFEGVGENEGTHRVVFEMFAGLRLLRPTGGDVNDLTEEQVEDLVCATFECEFIVKYTFSVNNKNPALDEECLYEFAKHNVPLNIWPYWREIVQSACGRMALPRIVLPLHKLQKSAEERPVEKK